MKILHYFLGFPPYRSGGLTNFCMDLMNTQVRDGHSVSALWPGKISLISRKIRIRNDGMINGIRSFELENPLPVPLDEGIKEVKAFMALTDKQKYIDFLREIVVDVIHVHTLMGIHKEFFSAARELNIRIIFTTHDYFGICPKVTLYKNGSPCKNDCNCDACAECNRNALSLKKIMFMQSLLYRKMKNSFLVKKLRKKHRKNFFDENSDINSAKELLSSSEEAEIYRNLRDFYLAMLKQVDVIHFNSTIAQRIYMKYITPVQGKVITISNKEIFDNRFLEQNSYNQLRLTYLSPPKSFKGFNLIRNVLNDLWNHGVRNFELHLYCDVTSPEPYMKIFSDGFQRNELEKIFKDTDVLLAPSIWYETFGFTVLEAMSYAVPVIVSKNVGASDIVGNGGIVIEANSESALKEAIMSLTSENIMQMKQNIRSMPAPKTWKTFVQEIYQLLKG